MGELTLAERLRAYHEVDRRRSWRRLWPTLAALLVAWPALFSPLPVAVRLPIAVLVAGLLLRLCTFGHDWAHGAIFRGSRAGAWVGHAIGVLVLAPVRIWSDTHNHHHRHTALLGAPPRGTFPVWTLDEYRRAGRAARLGYRLVRSPLAILLAWPLVFVLALNLAPLLQAPRRHRGSALALAVHAALHGLALSTGGLATWLLAIAAPYGLLGAAGAYLFYVQHNFPGARLFQPAAWRSSEAALAGSSYLGLPRLLHWFTGEIGYHHIHHLDPRVPFYRLAEAHAAEPELRRAPDTTLAPRDVLDALALAVWDGDRDRLIRWRELPDR